MPLYFREGDSSNDNVVSEESKGTVFKRILLSFPRRHSILDYYRMCFDESERLFSDICLFRGNKDGKSIRFSEMRHQTRR